MTLPQRVLLVGMMGAGKSTVGRLLAERLGWPFVDTDDEVETVTGMTVPELFARRGEAAFRAEESRVLASVTASPGPVVVGVAGGAVLDPDNRRRLRAAGLVVWLRADPAELLRRVGSGTGRPLLAEDPVASLHRLDAERRPLYQELADVIVDVDGLDADRAALEVHAALKEAGGGRA